MRLFTIGDSAGLSSDTNGLLVARRVISVSLTQRIEHEKDRGGGKGAGRAGARGALREVRGSGEDAVTADSERSVRAAGVREQMSPSVASHLKALGPSLAKQRALCADDRCSQQRALRPHLAEHLAKPPAAGGGQALRSGFKDGPRRSSHVRRAQEGGRGREDAAGSRPGAGRQVRVLARRVSPVTREMPAARQGTVSESTPRGPPARVAGRGAGVRQKGGSRAGKGVEGGRQAWGLQETDRRVGKRHCRTRRVCRYLHVSAWSPRS